ncbi:unnamed protein product [marine sediment metagenome]|uniref:Uncharacterized protein n=1 Tax=marine sediment metagenome TaxID=412755 RepID=X1CPK1_9ZZZZ
MADPITIAKTSSAIISFIKKILAHITCCIIYYYNDPGPYIFNRN